MAGTARNSTNKDATTPEVMSDRELALADQGKAAVVSLPTFDDDALREIGSWDDAVNFLSEQDVEIVQASDVLGNGFAILNDKNNLVGVPLLLMGWRFNQSGTGGFVSVYALAKIPGLPTPAKVIVNDGGSGIYKTLLDYTSRTKRNRGLVVSKGLSRSDYEFTDSEGNTRPATTFYLDTSVA